MIGPGNGLKWQRIRKKEMLRMTLKFLKKNRFNREDWKGFWKC